MNTTQNPIVDHDVFLRNMRFLWRRDPALAVCVDAVDDQDRVAIEAARNGQATARVQLPDGKTVYLHSRHDPGMEAKKWAAAVDRDEKFCVVVSGSGLGHHLRALFDLLHDEAIMICMEPSMALVASALACVDLTDAIDSDRLIFLVDDDKTRIHERLRKHSTLIMLGTQFARHLPSVRFGGSASDRIHEALSEFVTFSRMSLLTLLGNARITCKNIAMNLPNYVATPPIDCLHARFRGCPGIVISAGPSLSKNLNQLTALKGKAVLCAVQTALRPLTRRGIVPDFVTSLDFHEMSRKFYDGVDGLEHVHLVAEPKATWHVTDTYPGPMSLLDNHWARLVAGDELGGRDGLTAGATVAHLAFYLAVYMGCDPIIFVGQDLAFTGHVFYVPGVEIHRAWRGEINRFNSMEQKEWDRIVRNRPILRKVTGNDGTQLYTDELLFTYLEQFEKDIRGVAATVINATEGGARIRGTTVMSLKEAADRFCKTPIDKARFHYQKEEEWWNESRLASLRDVLQTRIASLDEVEEVCDELLGLFDELRGLTGDPARFNERITRVDELRVKVHQDTRAYEMVNAATQVAELRRYRADRLISASCDDDVERAKRQIERDSQFITSVREGARDVRGMLEETLKRTEDPPRRKLPISRNRTVVS